MRAVQVRLARLAAYQGRAGECRAHAAELADEAIAPEAALTRGLARWALGLLELGAGRWEAAFANLAEMAGSSSWTQSGWLALVAAADYVEAAAPCRPPGGGRASAGRGEDLVGV
jgi:hypothetical protein